MSLRVRRQSGFTLIEAMLMCVIIGIGTMAWLSSMNGYMKISKKSRASFQMVLEQQSLSKILEAMPQSAVLAATCPLPHPYGHFNPTTGNCEEILAPSATQMTSWSELSKGVFRWIGATSEEGGISDEALSKNYFDSTIVPLMGSAGCLTCHGGGSPKSYTLGAEWPAHMSAAAMRSNNPEIDQRDFSNYNHIVRDFTYTVGGTSAVSGALASRSLFGSPLGQSLLKRVVTVENYLSDSRGISSTLSFQAKQIKFQLVTMIPNARKRVAVNPVCPTLTNANACDTSKYETYSPTSCIDQCTILNPPPVCSCGKGCVYVCGSSTCAEYTADYQCLSPNGRQVMSKSGLPGDLNGVAAFNPPAFQNRPNSECLNLGGEVQCGGVECSDPKAGEIGKCVDRCQRICSVQSFTEPVICGKGCVTPPMPDGCLAQRWEYECVTTLPPAYQFAWVVSYSINSQVTDKETGELKSLSTGGALK